MPNLCFNCGNPATTQDHIPPKVFFPEQKDLEPGVDLRKGLITANACSNCNNGAARVDELVAYWVATSHANNQVAMNHVATKVLRALKRSPAFAAKFLTGKNPVLLDGEPTVTIPVDFNAFNSVMVRIARGLHFARTGSRLTDELLAISPLILGPNYPYRLWAVVEDAVARLPWIEGPGCKNPEVFNYRYLDGAPVFDFTFYGGFHVLVNRKQ